MPTPPTSPIKKTEDAIKQAISPVIPPAPAPSPAAASAPPAPASSPVTPSAPPAPVISTKVAAPSAPLASDDIPLANSDDMKKAQEESASPSSTEDAPAKIPHLNNDPLVDENTPISLFKRQLKELLEYCYPVSQPKKLNPMMISIHQELLGFVNSIDNKGTLHPLTTQRIDALKFDLKDAEVIKKIDTFQSNLKQSTNDSRCFKTLKVVGAVVAAALGVIAAFAIGFAFGGGTPIGFLTGLWAAMQTVSAFMAAGTVAQATLAGGLVAGTAIGAATGHYLFKPRPEQAIANQTIEAANTFKRSV